MKSILLFAGLCCFGLTSGAKAQTTGADTGWDPSTICTMMAQQTEAFTGVPSGVLQAIAASESGSTTHRNGWPYAVNNGGAGYWFPTEAAAIAFVTAALQNGAHAIDVGCFQIDLEAHPDAFVNLEQAFSPQDGALFAAGLLLRLHNQSNSWMAAIAAYHSSNWQYGIPYENRVRSEMPSALAVDPDVPPPVNRPGPVVISIGPEQPPGSFVRVTPRD